MKPFTRNQRLRIVAIAAPICFVGMFFFFTMYLYSYSYEAFLHSILESIQRTDIEKTVRTSYFSNEKFTQLRIALASISFILVLCLMALYYYRNPYLYFIENVSNSFFYYLNKIKIVFYSFSKQGKWVLLLLIFILLIRSIYYATSFYIQYDEAWNYSMFLNKQLFYSIGAYNNYPLHNIVTWFFVNVFGNSVLALRLPSICIGLLSAFYVAIVLKYFLKNEWIAICVTTVFVCLPVSVFYMMYARGVLFEIFFSIVISSLLFYYINNGLTYKRVLLLATLNAFATYSMLSHPYFIVGSSMALVIYSLLLQKKIIGLSFSYAILSLLFSLILLVPMMLGTGLSPGLSVLVSKMPFSINDFLTHIKMYSSFITGFDSGFYLLFLFFTSLLFSSYKKINLILVITLFNLSLLLLMIIIPVFTKVFPPERAFGFLAIAPVSFVAIFFLWLQKAEKSSIALLPIVFLIATYTSYQAHTSNYLNWSKRLDKLAYDAYSDLAKEKINLVYNDCRNFDYFIPGIDFYCKQNNKNIIFYSSAKNSTRYQSFIADSIPCVVYCNEISKKDGFISIGVYDRSVLYKRDK